MFQSLWLFDSDSFQSVDMSQVCSVCHHELLSLDPSRTVSSGSRCSSRRRQKMLVNEPGLSVICHLGVLILSGTRFILLCRFSSNMAKQILFSPTILIRLSNATRTRLLVGSVAAAVW